MKYLLIFILSVLLMGCCSTRKSVVVEEKVITVEVPELSRKELPGVKLNDSLIIAYVLSDSSGDSKVPADTIGFIAYNPKQNTFDLGIKPKPVEKKIIDTISVYQPEPRQKESESESFFTSWKFLIVSGLVFVFIVYIFFNRRK